MQTGKFWKPVSMRKIYGNKKIFKNGIYQYGIENQCKLKSSANQFSRGKFTEMKRFLKMEFVSKKLKISVNCKLLQNSFRVENLQKRKDF